MQLINFPFSGPEAYTNNLLHRRTIQFAFCQFSKKTKQTYSTKI